MKFLKMRNRCFKYSVELVQAESGRFFGCSMISLKLTVNQVS